MKKKETINSPQMAILFFSFVSGSPIVFLPQSIIGINKNAPSLAMIISTLIGLFYLACVLYVHKQYPELTFVELSERIIGKWFSWLLNFFFMMYLFVVSSWIINECAIFINSTIMHNTPLYVFEGLLYLIVVLVLYNGFETLTRMVVILTFLVIVFSLIVLLLASMNYDTTLLFPLFPKGIKPFFYDILWTIGHPFGETVIIFSLLPRVNPDDKPHLGKLMYATLIMDGIFLSLLITCTIMTFGPLASDINYSLYAISQTIRIADFFDRIESVVGIVLIIICTVRAIIVLYILNLSICKSFRLKNERILILPLIIASFLHALSMVKQHRDLLDYYVSWFPFVGLVILAVPFLLITLIVFIRSKKNNLKPPKSTG